MQLTTTYKNYLPSSVLSRYEICEVRNAATVLYGADYQAFQEIVGILSNFKLTDNLVLDPGGNKSVVAGMLDREIMRMGWRETQVDISTTLHAKMMPYRKGGEKNSVSHQNNIKSNGYKVDGLKRRVVIDVEWNAKEGHFDRDLAAYRVLYEVGFIDVGVIITRTMKDLVDWVKRLDADSTKYATSTTTHIEKLENRLTRGDAGGCPVLGVAICSNTV